MSRWPYRGATPAEGGFNPELAERFLVEFLREEVGRRRGFSRVVVAVSGGIDSAVTTALAVRAFGPGAVTGLSLPYRTSSPDSREDAAALARELGVSLRTIDITPLVDGYLAEVPGADARRRGNVMARARMIILFDQGEDLGALPLGTGNKTERLLGYFTWHADDSPPVNPLGDLFKSEVFTLATHLGLPQQLIEKPPSADLTAGQTDEGDLGITYARADAILGYLVQGYPAAEVIRRGFPPAEVELVYARVGGTHWKRHQPTVAVLSGSAINEFYLRPVDF